MKLKQWIKKLIKKGIDFVKWVWRECKNWQTILLFGVVCAVIGLPVWSGGLLYLIFGWKWALAMAVACLAFWWLPGTPFLVLSLTVTLAIKRWGFKAFSRRKKGEIPVEDEKTESQEPEESTKNNVE